LNASTLVASYPAGELRAQNWTTSVHNINTEHTQLEDEVGAVIVEQEMDFRRDLESAQQESKWQYLKEQEDKLMTKLLKEADRVEINKELQLLLLEALKKNKILEMHVGVKEPAKGKSEKTYGRREERRKIIVVRTKDRSKRLAFVSHVARNI